MTLTPREITIYLFLKTTPTHTPQSYPSLYGEKQNEIYYLPHKQQQQHQKNKNKKKQKNKRNTTKTTKQQKQPKQQIITKTKTKEHNGAGGAK